MSSALLPANATQLERALADTSQLDTLPVAVDTLWDPQRCPVALLPWLAWALSVDEWDATWTEATQRAVIAAAIGIHRRKGTVGAVRSAIAALGYRVDLSEWWQQDPRGTPHTFRADFEIDDRGIDETIYNAIERQIETVKPARSHCTIRVFGTTHAGIHHACAVMAGDTIDIRPFLLAEATAPMSRGPRLAIGLHSWMTTEVRPQ